MSGVFKHLCGGLFQHFQGTLPDGAVQHTGLAETAAADAGSIKFVLLRHIGDAFVERTLTDEELLEAIRWILGEAII